AVAGLREVGEAVAGDLEARLVPRGVAVRRPLDDTERGLERGAGRADREREARLGQPAAIVPVEARVEVDPRRAGPQADVLDDARVAERALDADRRPVRPVLHELHRAAGELDALVGVGRVELPGVPLARLVDVGPDLVAAPVEYLAPRPLV